ncbi:hypothetical protein [Marinifilum flexuosum]|uniref:Uncharacterized protein n=1 Tax=Marinifilum flexuosum TaxID=1117708 RepID=A0A419X3K7_9BACT|nr:hypothetical protein [Marinifilum flexuosum]RKE02301.1 hypothetical protein BXY64_2389 [Marinifilum flexuosum]
MTAVNIEKRKIFKRRRDGQVPQGGSVSVSVSSSPSSSEGEFNPAILQDYAKKVDVHMPSQKALLDALSVEAGYIKYQAAALSVDNADKLGGVVAASYARRDAVNTYEYDQTINADLYVNGNIIQNGSAYETHAEHLNVENNLMQLNVGEPGSQITGVIPGTAIAFSGIEINRGAGEAYYMGVVEGVKPLLKLGKKDSLEAIATRADDISDDWLLSWDLTNKRIVGKRLASDYWHKDNSNKSDFDWNSRNLRAYGNLTVNGLANFATTVQLGHNKSIQGLIAGGGSYGNLLSMGADNYAHIGNSSVTEGVKLYSKGNHLKFETTSAGVKVSGQAYILRSGTIANLGSVDDNSSIKFGLVANNYGYGISTNQNGGLDIMANQASQPIRLWSGTKNETPTMSASFYGNAGVKLYYNSNKRFETTSTGTKTVGNHEITGVINAGANTSGGGLWLSNSSYKIEGGNYFGDIRIKAPDRIRNYINDSVILELTGLGATINGYIGSPSYESGITGTGWRISQAAHGELTNLDIRESLTCNTFTNNQINISNGDLIVSDHDEIEKVLASGTTHTNFYFSKEQPFQAGDVLRCQGSKQAGNIKSYYVTVASVGTSTSYKDDDGEFMKYVRWENNSKTGSGIPEVGDVLVRWNSSDAARKGLLYLSSSTTYSPFYDVVYDGITVSRFGKLDGITSPTFGDLSGYGFWSQKGYLEGGINASFGKIADWNIKSDRITKRFGNIDTTIGTQDSTSIKGFHVYQHNSTTGGNRVSMGYLSDDNWGIWGTKDGSNVFRLGSHNTIAGWEFTSTYLKKDNICITTGASGIYSQSDKVYWILRQNGSGHLANGNITWDTSGNVTFGSSVKLQWESGINSAQQTANNAYDLADEANDLAVTKITSEQATAITQNTVTSEFINGQNCQFTQGKIGNFDIKSSSLYSGISGKYLTLQNSETDSVHGGARRGLSLYSDNSTLSSSGAVKIVQFGMLCNKDTVNQWGETPNYGFRILRGNSSSTYKDIFRADAEGAFIAGCNFNDSQIWVDDKWSLKSDGSGYFAKGNIAWDTAGNINFKGRLTTNNSTEVGKETHHLLIDGDEINAVNGSIVLNRNADEDQSMVWIHDGGAGLVAHFSGPSTSNFDDIKFYRKVHMTASVIVSSDLFCYGIDVGIGGITSDGNATINGILDATTIMEGNQYLSDKYALKTELDSYLLKTGGTISNGLIIGGSITTKGAVTVKTRIITYTTTLTNTDYYVTASMSSSSSRTVYLPSNPTAGRVIKVKRRGGSQHPIINGNGKSIYWMDATPVSSITIDWRHGAALEFIYDGVYWCVICENY